MIGIALILDPRMKKDFLKNVLVWTSDWVLATDDHFKDAFEFYRKQMEAPEVQSTTVESSQSKTSSFESFMNAKRHCAENNSTTTQDEEFVRYYFIC